MPNGEISKSSNSSSKLHRSRAPEDRRPSLPREPVLIRLDGSQPGLQLGFELHVRPQVLLSLRV